MYDYSLDWLNNEEDRDMYRDINECINRLSTYSIDGEEEIDGDEVVDMFFEYCKKFNMYPDENSVWLFMEEFGIEEVL